MSAIERLESRSYEIRGDVRSALRVFTVADQTRPNLALQDADIPEVGDPFPDDPTLVAVRDGRSARLVPGHNDLCEVLVPYAPGPVFSLPDDPTEDPRVSFAERSGSFDTVIKPVYRVGDVTFPADPSSPTPGTDIGGTSVDMFGETGDRPHKVRNVTITRKVRFPAFALYDFMQNRRNSTDFLGGAAGKIIYAGVDFQELDDGWNESHRFIKDEWYHLEQQALRDENRKVKVTDDPTNSAIKRAESVYWWQPFPDEANFAAFGFRFRQ